MNRRSEMLSTMDEYVVTGAGRAHLIMMRCDDKDCWSIFWNIECTPRSRMVILGSILVTICFTAQSRPSSNMTYLISRKKTLITILQKRRAKSSILDRILVAFRGQSNCKVEQDSQINAFVILLNIC